MRGLIPDHRRSPSAWGREKPALISERDQVPTGPIGEADSHKTIISLSISLTERQYRFQHRFADRQITSFPSVQMKSLDLGTGNAIWLSFIALYAKPIEQTFVTDDWQNASFLTRVKAMRAIGCTYYMRVYRISPSEI